MSGVYVELKMNNKTMMENIRDFPKFINGKTIATAIAAAIFGWSACIIIISVAQNAGFTQNQIISWLFGIYTFGGLISIYLALKYRQPICGAWSVPASALVISGAVGQFGYSNITGAFFLAGLIVFILGITGLVGKIMRFIPLQIVMGMIVGAMIRFGTGMIVSGVEAPLIALATFTGFVALPKLTKNKISPVLGALIVGIIYCIISGNYHVTSSTFAFVAPQFVMPTFSLEATIAIAIPLAVLVIGAENAQAMGCLMAEGYNPPINGMTRVSGIGGMLSGLFGAHNANIAGPMTAITASSDSGEFEGRYAASVINGVLFGTFGIFASFALGFIYGLPSQFVSMIAGLSMINVIYNSIQEGFKETKFKYGAFFALVIGMSGIVILKISAPFWSLVGGTIVSLLMESEDFKIEKNITKQVEETQQDV